MVFYSSENRKKLMGLIAQESIDGVYCVNREHFVTETTDIIRASIRRFQDVETMRGVFLSAVAAFDGIVKEALLKGVEGLPEPLQKKITDGLLGRVEKFHTKRLAEIQKLDKALALPVVLDKLQAGSSQELSCLIDLLSLAFPSVSHQTALDRLKGYQTTFLPGRNDLAHVEESTCGTQGIIERNGRTWNPEELGQYRQNIIDHYENLRYIRDAIVQELTEHLVQQAVEKVN